MIASQIENASSKIPSFNERIGMAREKDLFLSKEPLKYGHQPFLYAPMNNQTDDNIMIAVLFNELNLLQHASGNKALKKELSKIDFTPDYSKPSYVGKDGKVVSLYLQGVDCGFFFIYDIASNTMTFDFVRKDAADRVETELFQTCTSGYKQYNPEDLQYWLDCMAENYQENMKQLGY